MERWLIQVHVFILTETHYLQDNNKMKILHNVNFCFFKIDTKLELNGFSCYHICIHCCRRVTVYLISLPKYCNKAKN